MSLFCNTVCSCMPHVTHSVTEHSATRDTSMHSTETSKFCIENFDSKYLYVYKHVQSGFGGLGFSALASGTRVRGRKDPQHAFLQRGSKTVGPMSYFAACVRSKNGVEVVISD